MTFLDSYEENMRAWVSNIEEALQCFTDSYNLKVCNHLYNEIADIKNTKKFEDHIIDGFPLTFGDFKEEFEQAVLPGDYFKYIGLDAKVAKIDKILKEKCPQSEDLYRENPKTVLTILQFIYREIACHVSLMLTIAVAKKSGLSWGSLLRGMK